MYNEKQWRSARWLLLVTSGFLPRVRASALRAPVFLGSLPRRTGRCAPPTHRSFAAFSSYSKNKNNLPSRPREEPFLFNSTTEVREYSECQAFYPVVRIGPPTLSTARECDSSSLDPRGDTHSYPDEGVGENQFRRWGIHSGTPAPHTAASLIFPANNK